MRAFCLVFSVSLGFSLVFCFLLPFSLSPSLSLSCLSSCCFFLFSLLVCFSFLFPFVSLFFSFYLVYLFFVSRKEQHQNITLEKENHHSFLIFGLMSCFFLSSLFSLSLLCLLFKINVFFFLRQVKNTNFGSRGGLQQNGFIFLSPVFCKMWKVIVFLPNFGWCLKCKNRYFGTLSEAKNKNHFEVLLSGPSRCYYLVQVWCFLKVAWPTWTR